MVHFKASGVSVRKLTRILLVTVLLTLLSSAISIVQAQPPALILSKTTDGNITTAEVGQVLHYRIRFECSSLSTACGELTITDVLQAGLTYLPAPDSSVPAGFTISYNAGTRTVTITKDDNNFLDGTQFDAVIAVLIDYNLRPLPQTINNTVNGTVDPPGPVGIINATPASAPPITVDTATLDWGMTKTLYRPSINPTVDTDVTYRIALCPNTNEGNVALQNVVITDNLPAGAIFVSASDGGTAAGGVVTWPTVVGPTYPPACITRYVTIRYPTPTFAVGDNVTNTASANGEYLGSNGAIIGPGSLAAPPTINHPIDPIAEVPTYNKSDVGDPVGINGTGRFVLNLNTNNTNYPSNNVVLIDNMPPNLQVTEVTSGSWGAAFDNVRAFVEYSTNYGSTWTAFPGQPILYNTNATYTAPAANITNVRWRFEYDDPIGAPFFENSGLPYTWSFTGRPEIRVVPRLTATTADAPSNAPMPVAAPGNTYTNCLQVSRTNSAGNPVTEPCYNETMTVQGNFASLRTYKNETPGTSWDDIGDPNINTFTADTTLLPNDTLRYVITVELTERSSAPLINPTIRDTIPAGLIFVRNGTAQLNGVNLPAGQQPTFTIAGSDLTWEWNAGNAITVNQQVLGSQFLTVEFYGRVPRGQAPGPYTNNLQVVTDSVDAYCEVGTSPADVGDLDGDGNFGEPTCVNPDIFTVERSAALRGEKWIRSTDAQNAQVLNSTTFLPDATCPDGGTVGLPGGGTNPFTRFPCISQAFPEGALSAGQLVPPPSSTTLDDFEYNLRVFNDGNVDMTQYILYDILPYFGDTGSGGTLSSTPRLSEFQPLMRGPIQFISGPPGVTAANFTIEYNNTINPCRPEVFNQATGVNTPGGCDNNWSAVWTANARSYRIRMNAGSLLPQTAAAPELRFGVPMYIPADAPPVGTFSANDPQSLEIAWNSFSHTGSYLDLASNQRDLLASEPRKVGITIPERMSIGNRVWRDADNSGTINPPDDTNPGIGGVTVNLYRDTDNNGVPDGAAIATTTTDANGYYLFSNIIFDAVTPGNNIYIVGIPASNFGVGQPLFNLQSSTGPLPAQAYVNPALGTTDSDDNGRDPATPGLEVFSASINLTHNNQPTGETDLSTVVPAPGVPSTRDGAFGRGVNGEQDNDSNLQIDFGFFSQVDYFSIGNRVWFDNGAGGGVINNGIMDGGETPFQGVTVELYRDGNANGVPDANEIIRTDVTDAGGYYLFDQLDPGNYFVVIPASNFNPTTGVLRGLFSSQPTGTELVGVAGNPTTPNTDRDDNGINVTDPSASGVRSGVIVLTLGVPEATGETDLSGDPDPGAATHFNNNPTAWDGPGSIGRYGEDDDNSNVTIDFGFIPPMSIGNRVWFDSGAGITPFRSGFNNGLMDGTEPGVAGVRVELWQDTDGTAGLQRATDTFLGFTTTDANGYYLFDRVQPGTGYYIHIPADNFGNIGAGDTVAGDPLLNYISSYDANQTTAPADDNEDTDDNGIDSATPLTTGITSSAITMAYGTEPLTPANETDISANVAAYGAGNRGLYGQADADSNLTFDFGFVNPPRSIGNRLWYDVNNNGQLDVGELPVVGARVSLYLDANANNVPDDLGVIGDNTDDWVAFDTTDANGYYLFDNLPPNIYIVGVDSVNFRAGQPLDEYASSTTTVNNATNNTDSRDNGIDRVQPGDATLSPYGVITARINMTATPVNAPTGETGSGNVATTLGFNPTAGDGPNSRGRYGETDANSDLTIDFGFFKPMSIGNRVFLDNGAGGGTTNNGIMDGGEAGIAGVRVELYRDNNSDGVPDGAFIRFDTTDANGFYLFDELTAGNYIVGLPASNFTAGTGALAGLNSSQPTGTENVGIAGNPYTPNTDRDDNGVNATNPAATGVFSGTIVLTVDTEPTGETELSGQADPGAATRSNFSPTGWDGPNSRGRWNESDDNSNLTIDFGFIPPLSLGNRVWLDNGAGGAGIQLYNDGIQNGTEAGIANVALSLFFDINDDGDFLDAGENVAIRTTTTNAQGYYLFDGLAPGNYQVLVTAANFGAAQPLNGLQSSTGNTADNTTDVNDNGIDDANYLVNGIRSNTVSLRYGTQPLTPADETDIPANTAPNTTAYGANLRGRNGEADADSNLTIDFGFNNPPFSLGNRVWLDTDNSGTINGVEVGIANVTVNLLDTAGNPVDNPNITGAQNYVVTTDANGYYRFDGLPAGDYVVEIAAANFTGANALSGLASSTGAGQEATPNSDVDSNDNGLDTPVAGAIRSGTVTLGPTGTEPINEADLGPGGQGTVPDNRGNMTVDFGFYQAYSLGNRVWLDNGIGIGGVANDGLINGTEAGIANVLVNLLTPAGATVDNPNLTGTQAYTATTDANGYYRFDNLPAGNYVVEIAAGNFATAVNPLFGFASSTGAGQEATPNSDVDSNDNGLDTAVAGAIRSGTVTLGTGNSEPINETDLGPGGQGTVPDARGNMTVDFGFYQAYSLGNRVWLDTDNSGTINGAETGIAGVTVNLLSGGGVPVGNPNVTGNPAYTATTDANGFYRFDNLIAGDYIVEIAAANFNTGQPLNGLSSSTGAGQEADPNNDVDSNDNGLDTPVAGAIRADSVTLGPGSAEPTGETNLSASGQGLFPDNRANMTVDFGFFGAYSLGNRVWLDTDNSGTINGGEAGIDGVTVRLLDTAGNPVDDPNQSGTQDYTFVTTGGGYYRFDNLPAGDYVVEIAAANFNAGQPLNGLASSGGAQEANPNLDVDSNDNGLDTPVAGAIRSGTVTLGPGNTEPTGETNLGPGGQGTVPDNRGNMTVDFGFYTAYSLGNRVWIDVDNDGTINAADGVNPGVDGVTVNLLTAAGAAVDNPNLSGVQNYTVVTDGNGYYRFDNLPAGDYIVEIAAGNFAAAGQPLFGFASSTGAGQEATPNSDGDSNDNGLDTAVAGAIRSGTVTLGTGNSEPINEADLATTGSFIGQGAQDNRANMTVDFGFYQAYSLGNRVWLDSDNSGTINGGELGIANVVVNLLNAAGNPVDNPNLTGTQNYTATTDATGYYRFDNLLAGDYIVEIAAANFNVGQPLNGFSSSTGAGQEANPNADVDSNDNGLDTPVAGAIRSDVVTLGVGNTEPAGETDLAASGQGLFPDARANMTVDFGFFGAYSLGNRVWLDTDNSGTINGGEAGIDGVTVNLLDTAGNPVDNPNLAGTQNYTFVTAGGGYYRFDNLPAGDYVVEIAAGNFTTGNPLFGLTSSTGAGQEANPNLDVDSNDNGIDTPIAGAIRSGTVTLGTGNSEPINEADLGPGGQGTVPDARGNMTVDFGFYTAYSLGNRVWLDADNSGTINGGETGIANVVVNLLTTAGAAVDNPNLTGTQNYTVTTDANGYYRFDNLPAGDYVVEIAAGNFATAVNPLFGHASSTGAGQEANPNTDGDSNDNGIDTPVTGAIRSGTVTLGTGNSEPINETDLGPGAQGNVPDAHGNMTVDFGFYQAYSLGNRVWLDTDNSGTINGGELGIVGVTVNLLDTAGNPVDNPNLTGTQNYTATTDATGYYRFDNLPAGDYVVEIAAANFTGVNPLAGFTSSTGAGQEANPNLDGDSNDNGLDTPVAGAIRSGTVTLGTGNSEPINEADLAASGQGPTVDARANMTVDFGFFGSYALGNRVWLDTDNSGTINGAETGITGVTVRLLDTAGNPVDNPNVTGTQDYTLVTDANGYYRFDGLFPGDYVVEIAAGNFTTGNPLFGHASSTGAGQEANPNTDGDSNDNGLDTPVTGAIRSGTVTLGPGATEPLNEADLGPGGQGLVADGASNLTVDFGFYQAYNLGNRVWVDSNNSGNIDGADGVNPGVANVVVNLLTTGGAAVDNPNLTGTQAYTVTTDANGYYRFDNLPAGDYVVEIAAGNFTPAGAPLYGYFSSTGAAEEANPNNNVDSNDNGIDIPVAGAIRSGTVTLGTGDVEPINEVDLAAAGIFAGQGPTVDARANMTVDFGFYPAYTLGNRVWADLDNSGTINGFDTANPGIAGVVVNLLTSAGAAVDNPNVAGVQAYTVTTDANGYYRFDNLPAGNYIVEIDATNFAVGGVLRNATSSSGAGQEANPNTDGDSNDNGLDTPVAGAIRSDVVTLGPGDVEPINEADLAAAGAFAGQGPTIDARANMTVDFGFVPGFSLGNRVWMDDGIGGGVANDGIINGGELGIANVQVQLLDGAGNPADNPNIAGTQPYIVTTDANGYYRFDRLPAGDYIVEVIAANFAVGQPLQSVGSSNVTEANPNVDVDNTDNGIDALPAVAVRSGTVTLGPGYNEPLGEPDVPVAGAFATQGTVDAWANMTVDFGFVRLFSLGNRVWRDDGIGGGVLNDGIQNGAEAGINNVTVRLLDAAGNPADNPNIAGIQDYVVTTSPQGYYRFDNLSAGNYIVEIVAANFVGGGTLANFASSTGAEANPNADVDANDNGLDVPVAGGIRSGVVTLGPLAAEPINEDAPFGQGAPDLQANMTVDFGFVPGSYSLGNRVWIDTDNSGTINGGEAGVNGVTVRLLNNVGTLITTTTTAGGGYYRFDNLAAGNYIVEIAAANFGAGQPLFGLVSSTGAGQEANPNADVDSNDNGLDTPFAGAIRSGTVTLGPGDSEPLNEADLSASGQGALDPRANMTVDFGFITPPIVFSLGNRVWFDADNNGTINAFDGPTPGIANVTVNLLNAGGALLATTTTDATGHYRFDNLAAGDYIVEIAAANFGAGQPLFNRISSTGPGQEANPNSDVDNNDNGLDVPVAGAIRSGIVTLGPTAIEPVGETDVVAGGAPDNQSNLTVDFGFTNPVNTYSIGNRVWRDNGAGANMNNGRMDAGEAGIAGVTVNLLDGTGNATVATTTTDANGYYRFDNLPAGNYIVEIAATNFNAGNPLEATTSSTGAFQEANPNTDGDLNDNGLDVLVAGAVRSGVVTLGPGNSEPINETDLAPSGQGAADNRANMTVDFGFVDAFSLGNRVWRDDGTGGGTANNGIQDGTEPGIAGVTVRLLDGTGNTLIATTTTDANGYYRFDSLVPGTYIVEIAAGNFGVGQPLNGLSSSPVTNNNPNSDIDLDDNGLDVTVAGAVRSGQVTLGPTATEPVGETDLSPSGQGSPDNRANMTVDFGFGAPTNTYSLGNRVWLDDGTGGGVANDGIQNGTEIGEVGVTVNLIDSTGTLVLATTFTDANGYYRFDNLAAGNYFVEVAASNFAVGQPLNGLLSSAVTVADPNTDIDRDDNGIDAAPGSAIRSGQVTLGPGDVEPTGEADVSGIAPTAPDNRENLTVDFGFAAPGTTFSLGNRVWLDADNSGTINGAETGIAGVTVRLLNATGTNIIATTTTDANGYYRFDNLAPGDYIVEIASTNFTAGQPLEGLASSSGAGQEANPNADVDGNDNGLDAIINGGIRSAVVTLGPTANEPINEADVSGVAPVVPDNRENLTVDFGFTSSYSLGNRVWFDVNNNSTLDAGEVGIGGVRVELYRDTDANGAYTAGTDVLINAVNTDGLGYYLFTGLAAADYIVVIPASNFAAAGNPLFGYYSSATSRNPANGNLIETAAPDPDNDTDSDDNGTTTGTLGTPTGIVVSLPVTLGGAEPVGEPDPTSATFPDPTPDNRSNTTVDFGFYTMTLGNLVWFDANDNGIVDGTEAGLDGVTLYLFPAGGNLAGPPLATTVTANGGLYSFPGLAAGDYIVQIPANNFSGVLTGFSSSTGGAGNPFETAPGVDPNNGTDNDDNGVHTAGPASPINSRPITLTPGGAGLVIDNVTGRTTNNTLDFGLKSSAPLIFSLGNRVFLDYDNSGTQDPSEPGISGVQLRLLDSASNPYDTDPNTAGVQEYLVTTDVSGYYRFDNLPAGDYIVQILEVNFLAGGRLENYDSSTPDEILPNNDVDRNDNGIGTAFIPGTGIVSGVVTLGPVEPTGETDIGTGGQGAQDNRANMTVDFGFTPPVGLIITKDDGINAVMTGSTTTYTVNIFNNTGVDQTNVQFLDDVPVTDPEGFDPASVSWTCSSTPGGLCPNGNGTNANINETIALIPAGGRVIYSISGRVRPCQTGCGVSITNTASLGTGETSSDVDGIIADPFVGVKAGTVVNGTTVHWSMTWSSTTAAGVGQTVVITDTIPAGQSFAGNLTCQTSGTSTQISCAFANGAVVWEGTIFGTPANQVVISFDVNVSGPGSYSNSATLTEPGTNVSVVATASVGISSSGNAGPTSVPPEQCNITITPTPAFAVPRAKVDWAVNVKITDNTKPNIVTITLPKELTLLGVDAPKGATVTVKNGVITITIDPGVALGNYPTITVRTRISRNLKAPFTITVLGSMNDSECQASITILSVDALPETGQHPPLNVGGILLMLAGISAGFGLIVVGWQRRKQVAGR